MKKIARAFALAITFPLFALAAGCAMQSGDEPAPADERTEEASSAIGYYTCDYCYDTYNSKVEGCYDPIITANDTRFQKCIADANAFLKNCVANCR